MEITPYQIFNPCTQRMIRWIYTLNAPHILRQNRVYIHFSKKNKAYHIHVSADAVTFLSNLPMSYSQP